MEIEITFKKDDGRKKAGKLAKTLRRPLERLTQKPYPRTMISIPHFHVADEDAAVIAIFRRGEFTAATRRAIRTTIIGKTKTLMEAKGTMRFRFLEEESIDFSRRRKRS